MSKAVTGIEKGSTLSQVLQIQSELILASLTTGS